MVDYRTAIKTITITPDNTVSIDNLVIDLSVSVTAIAKIIDNVKLLSKNEDGSITLQITEVQQFTP